MKKSLELLFQKSGFQLYMLFWLLYMFHWNNAQIENLDIYSNLFLGINLIVSFCFFLNYIRDYHSNNFDKSIYVLIALFVIYGCLSLALGDIIIRNHKEIKRATYFIAILRSFLPLFAFVILWKKRILNISEVHRWYYIFLFATIFLYYKSVLIRYSYFEYEAEFTNNIGYVFIQLLPMVLLLKNQLERLINIGIILFFILLCAKRGPMVIGVICTLWIIYNEFKTSSKKFFPFLIVFSFLITIIYYGYDFIVNSEYLQSKLGKTLAGNSSGRDSINGFFLNYYWNKTNPIQLIFGLGADATIRLGPNYAHNDWVEILFNMGIIGILSYLFFWLQSFKKLKQMKPNMKTAFSVCVIILFLQTFFSMSYSMIPITITIVMGYCIAPGVKHKRRHSLLSKKSNLLSYE